MNTRQLAQDLVDDATAAITGATTPPAVALVSLDPDAVAAALGSGLLVWVAPPTIDLETWTAGTATFPLHVIAPQPEDQLDAWDAIDSLIGVLIEGLGPDRLEPSAYPNPSGPRFPAYTLTITRNYDL